MSVSQRVVGRPILITVAFALVLIVGVFSIFSIAIDLFPDISPPYIIVSTVYTGSGPETVERAITKPLENSLSNVRGVSKMTSQSSDGLSVIILKFDYGKDLDKAANDVRDKVDAARDNLPDTARTPAIEKVNPSSMPILKIAIRGPRSAEELKRIGEDIIQPRIEQIDGVSSAKVEGGRTRIVRVDVSQNRLEAYGLTLESVKAVLAAQNLELGAGKITEGRTDYAIRTTGQFKDIGKDIANAVVARRKGAVVRLSDIAKVADGYEDADTVVYINGSPGVYLSIVKQSGKNTVATANAVFKKLEQVKKALPQDIVLETINDSSKQVRATISDLVRAIVEGAFLTCGFVFLFLRSAKSTFIVGLAIPISVITTLLIMYFAGFTLNMMTMTGLLISVGNIVDSSIVIIDNTFKYRERGARPLIAAMLGSQEMMAAVSAGILASVSVYIPMILFSAKLGMLGIIFKDMIFTIIISHLVSWVVAVFLVPVLASRYLPLTTREEKPLRSRLLAALDRGVGRGIEGLTNGYRRLLAAALKHRALTVTIVVLILLGSFLFLKKTTIIFSPVMGSDSVTLNVTLPLGTDLSTTTEVVNRLAETAKGELKGVKNIIATAGSSGSSGFIAVSGSKSYAGELTITLPRREERIDTFDTVKEKLRVHFKDYPSASFTFSAGNRMSESADIDIAISSTDYAAAAKASREILALIKREVPEVLEPESNYNEGLPQVEVVIDRERAYSFGISVSAVANEIRDAIKGTAATVYREGGNEYDVVLRLQEADRRKTLDLERVFVLGPSGERIPVSSIARLDKGSGPVDVRRENQARVIDITGSLAPGRQADQVEAKIKGLVAKEIALGSEVYVDYAGSWSDVIDMAANFGIILALAILLVFAVMAGQYESFRDPFINIFTIPLVVIGVILAYFLRGQPLSMFTAVGLVMLVGIVVNNGILLVDYTNLLRGRGLDLLEACIEGGASRLRPVIMTAGATILGVVPMAFFPSESADITQPIGLTVVGGLTSATFITLLFIPVVYYLVNKRSAAKEGTLT